MRIGKSLLHQYVLIKEGVKDTIRNFQTHSSEIRTPWLKKKKTDKQWYTRYTSNKKRLSNLSPTKNWEILVALNRLSDLAPHVAPVVLLMLLQTRVVFFGRYICGKGK